MADELEQSVEDADIDFTRTMRKRVIQAIAPTDIPGDNESRKILLSALVDMDRVSMGLKKLKSDEGIGNKQAEATALIARIFLSPEVKGLGKVELDSPEAKVREIPVFDANYKPESLVPGELDFSAPSEDYDAFMKRMKPDLQ